MKKILIIFNPVAGYRYKKNYRDFFINELKKHLPQVEYNWQETGPDFKNQLAQMNLADYGKIIIIGGDGTVKDVAHHLLTNNLDLPLAIIPAGSANVLASCLNIPLSHHWAIKIAALGQEKRMDVCLLNNQEYFLICLSIGHWSRIIKNTKQGLKFHIGFWAYLVNLLKHLKVTTADFSFNLDGQKQQVKGNTLVVANALSIFKLQPRMPIDWYDGKFDLLICQNKSLLGFFGLVLSFYLGKKRFPYLFKTIGRKIAIDYRPGQDQPVQIDGEMIEINSDKIEVEIVPDKLRVMT
jgi:diacylglycerol kinase family enzyme